MLHNSDLDAFVELVQRAEREAGPLPGESPASTLRSDSNSDDLLYRNEYARLRRSLKIAWAAGDVPESPHQILDVIVDDFSADDHRYLPLAHSEEWLRAIRWAIPRIRPSAADSLPHHGQDRQFQVGTACRRLRDRGYRVHIDALGPHLDDDTRREIAEHIDSLIAQIGGGFAAQQICAFIGKTGRVHDGMWLLGNLIGSFDRPLKPAIPVGWLLSIALRHIHRRQSTDNPTETWEAVVKLAVALSASMDCQRYNQFDGMYLHATDFFPALGESLKWRELFTLPQVPPSALTILRDAFSQIAWPDDLDDLRRDIDRLFGELDVLLEDLSVDRLTTILQPHARSAFPLLWYHARACQGAANAEYLDPFGTHARNHERIVFFETDDDHVVILPPAMATAAACEVIFRLVWTNAGSVASDIVGDTIEKSVAIACGVHITCVSEGVSYHDADGAKQEIDVAVRDDQEVVLFETKAKSLTSASRTGDIMAFINDYTKSFLALLRQLVRHEHNLKRGLTPLTRTDEDFNALRVTKIAVSPLCYGPASDHALAGSLFRSISYARFGSVEEKPEHVRILDEFNQKVEQIMTDIGRVASDEEGQIDLFRYMHYVFWLDLGQLLYTLHRGRSVVDGLSALRHLTFSTQDFWTEAAFADLQGLTENKWWPLSGSQPNT